MLIAKVPCIYKLPTNYIMLTYANNSPATLQYGLVHNESNNTLSIVSWWPNLIVAFFHPIMWTTINGQTRRILVMIAAEVQTYRISV